MTVVGDFVDPVEHRKKFGGGRRGQSRLLLEILEDLRQAAAEVGEPLSLPAYDRWRARQEVRRPDADEQPVAGIRVVQRFDTWGEACRQAGVRPPAPRRSYRRRWSRENCLEWVRRFLQAHPYGSYRQFNDWASEQDGCPSGQTVRNQVGTWAEAVEIVFSDPDTAPGP